jgi:hypothetical protein
MKFRLRSVLSGWLRCTKLFPVPMRALAREFALSHDCQRFLVITPSGADVVQNRTAGLNKK